MVWLNKETVHANRHCQHMQLDRIAECFSDLFNTQINNRGVDFTPEHYVFMPNIPTDDHLNVFLAIGEMLGIIHEPIN